MNPETNHPVPAAAAEAESRTATVPIWLVLLLFVLLYWGAIYFDQAGGWFNAHVYTPYRSYDELADYKPPSGDGGPDFLRRGEKLFTAVCSVCHGVDGAGKPGQAPPLAGSEWVNAPGVNRLVRIPVLGLTGTIDVNGKSYSIGAGMTAVAPNGSRANFSDTDLAAVLSFVRQAWGNKAGLVTTEQVKAIRDEIGTRTKQLTVDELKTIPEKK